MEQNNSSYSYGFFVLCHHNFFSVSHICPSLSSSYSNKTKKPDPLGPSFFAISLLCLFTPSLYTPFVEEPSRSTREQTCSHTESYIYGEVIGQVYA